MNFFKRAWLSITRRTGKSILLLAIILILGNAIAGAISIQQASQNVEKQIKAQMGAAASITTDYQKLEEFWRENAENPDVQLNIQPPTPELMQSVGSSAYVKYYDYSTQNYLGSLSFDRYVPQFLREQEGMMDNEWEKYNAFSLRGVQYHKVLSIEEGKHVLHSGRVFTEQEISDGASVALITKKLAELNNVSLGDTIVLGSFIFDYENVNNTGMPPVSKEIEVPLTVIGLFEPAPKPPTTNGGQGGARPDQWGYAWIEQQTMNTVIVPNAVVANVNNLQLQAYMELRPEDYEGVDVTENTPWYEPIFILNNPEDLEPFKEEVTPLLSEYYMVTTAADNYATIAAPVEQTSKMANYILIIAVAAAILIVTLVILLFLRDRKHELGVYLSLGEKKGSVVGQIVAEVLIIALIGITLSVFTGNFLAQGLSSSMIQAQMEKDAEDIWGGGGGVYYGDGVQEYLNPNITTQDVVSAYQIRLTPTYILIFYLVSLGTIILSTLVPMFYIVRLNPRKVLM